MGGVVRFRVEFTATITVCSASYVEADTAEEAREIAQRLLVSPGVSKLQWIDLFGTGDDLLPDVIAMLDADSVTGIEIMEER